MSMTRRGWFGRLVGGIAAAILGRKAAVGGRLSDDGTQSTTIHGIVRSVRSNWEQRKNLMEAIDAGVIRLDTDENREAALRMLGITLR